MTGAGAIGAAFIGRSAAIAEPAKLAVTTTEARSFFIVYSARFGTAERPLFSNLGRRYLRPSKNTVTISTQVPELVRQPPNPAWGHVSMLYGHAQGKWLETKRNSGRQFGRRSQSFCDGAPHITTGGPTHDPLAGGLRKLWCA